MVLCLSFVFKVMSKADVYAMWLGMYRPEGSEHLTEIRYNSNGKLIQYSAWRSGQPNNLGKDENCVVVTSSQDVQNWFDKECFANYRFICEIGADTSQPSQEEGSKFYSPSAQVIP